MCNPKNKSTIWKGFFQKKRVFQMTSKSEATTPKENIEYVHFPFETCWTSRLQVYNPNGPTMFAFHIIVYLCNLKQLINFIFLIQFGIFLSQIGTLASRLLCDHDLPCSAWLLDHPPLTFTSLIQLHYYTFRTNPRKKKIKDYDPKKKKTCRRTGYRLKINKKLNWRKPAK